MCSELEAPGTAATLLKKVLERRVYKFTGQHRERQNLIHQLMAKKKCLCGISLVWLLNGRKRLSG